jgi:hypothetical protein
MQSPAADYQARLQRYRANHAARELIDARLGAARLTVFGVAVVLAYLGARGAVSWWWLVAPAGVFLAVVAWHDRVIRAKVRAAALVDFYERGLARIEDRWIGTGATGDVFRDDRHPYATDLDLFGRGSLFELLCLARSGGGKATLAGWLKQPAEPAEIEARQHAVRELTPALDFREDLAVAGAAAQGHTDVATLLQWSAAPPLFRSRALRVIAFTLTATTLAALLWMVRTSETTPFLLALGAQAAFALPLERRARTVLHGADGPARSLAALDPTLTRLERERFAAPRLSALSDRVTSGREPATAAVSHLRRLVERHDWQHNPFFAPFALMLLWGTHLALALEAWRRAHGGRVSGWVDTVGEFEALSSLGAYAFEHPADPFPVLLGASAHIDRPAACFDAEALGHPLLPAATMVRNDVRLTGGTRLLLVSGSNMSGKSTLLRSVGINAVLAQMGAPVRAASLRLSPLRIGATLRIQDSLQEGRSRFYAEITRVRELADLARGEVPLLFLLDELFHGTNSHDRQAGAAGVLRSLLERGAIGLVTTHDLALTAMADTLGTAAMNVHFEDVFVHGEIHFDYRMKPGPVTRSNALALMRAVGLDVES